MVVLLLIILSFLLNKYSIISRLGTASTKASLFTSAPFPTNQSTSPRSPLLTAKDNGVNPSLSELLIISEFLFNKNSIISRLSLFNAQNKASLFTSAPCPTNHSKSSIFLYSAATCNGVLPSVFFSLIRF